MLKFIVGLLMLTVCSYGDTLSAVFIGGTSFIILQILFIALLIWLIIKIYKKILQDFAKAREEKREEK